VLPLKEFSSIVLLSLLAFQLQGQGDIKGACLVSPPQPVNAEVFQPLSEIGVNYVAIIPYAFSRKNEPRLGYDYERQWWGERTEGTLQLSKLARKQGLKIMIKPHVWVLGDGWPGDFLLKSHQEWTDWERDYKAYLLHHARLADSIQAEILCIGTELRQVVKQRPNFWFDLIAEIRTIYQGKLTYAANWDNYQQVPFWEALDFIGIDAYFPLDTSSHPSVEALIQAWEIPIRELSTLSQKMNKPILFTEYGYQSVERAAGPHWEVDKSRVNAEVQSAAYQALFQSVWRKPWFAGGFFWKWHFRSRIGGAKDAGFTPQGKPALHTITQYYRDL
jgi:hypothetical protein